ncbi:ABC transporter ATP-binding protein [Dactylosporangium sp. NPDC051485]|uniref:ABC transporter ATP-binding protein n=1 Tax=Dactylosporangium sp. NPDC051485 TaxID=3154846 RepID=UPI0034305CD6
MKTFRSAVADRLLLLRSLRDAGMPLMLGAGLIVIIQALLPPATAVAMAALVGRFTGQSTLHGFAAGAALPLAFFGAVLLAGHMLDTFVMPLLLLMKARIDGAHRARVAQCVLATPAIAPVEDSRVQDLIRLAAADPATWTERTPGDGALAQFILLTRYLSVLVSAAVLAAYALWIVPVLLVPSLLGRGMRRRQWLRLSRLWADGVTDGRRAEYWRELATTLAGAKEARVFGFTDVAVGRMEHHVEARFTPIWRLTLTLLRTQWISFLLVAVPLAVVYSATVLGVVGDGRSLALATAVLAAGWSVFSMIGGMQDAFDIEGVRPVLHAHRDLRAALAPHREHGSRALPADGASPPVVEFHGVSFRYPGGPRPVLQDLDLRIVPGELLAIVGLNGAGKTTLTKLLAGLYEPTAGRITVNGADLRELDPAAWRRHLSVVFQDFVKYELSVTDNVYLGRSGPPHDPAALARAADESGLTDLVERLPAAWDTYLARSREGGVDLSGGQWQQVALARALYATHAGASLLVLDEPTAHLDVRTEFEVFGRLAGRAGDNTVVLISHRLSTVRQADRIVVLDGGRVAESGSHDELMSLGGLYADMFALQAERFANGYDDRIDNEVVPR